MAAIEWNKLELGTRLRLSAKDGEKLTADLTAIDVKDELIVYDIIESNRKHLCPTGHVLRFSEIEYLAHLGSFPKLHDATLRAISMDWETGSLAISIDTASAKAVIHATEVSSLNCMREAPWGPSSSINQASTSTTLDSTVLELEMQSGDLIRINAKIILIDEGAN